MKIPFLLLFLASAACCAEVSLHDRIERRVFELTQKQRKGLPILGQDSGLAAVARAHSRDMLEGGYFDHVNAKGQRPQDRVSIAHRHLIGLVSENIWMWYGGSQDPEKIARKAVESLMNSPGHRRNILSDSATHMGIGVWMEGEAVYVTQLFAEVSGYLENDVPTRVPGFGVLQPAVRSSTTPVDYFDLEPVGGGNSTPKAALTAGLPLENLRAGEYRLRFWFRNGDRGWMLIPGPTTTVRGAAWSRTGRAAE